MGSDRRPLPLEDVQLSGLVHLLLGSGALPLNFRAARSLRHVNNVKLSLSFKSENGMEMTKTVAVLCCLERNFLSRFVCFLTYTCG